ncbi:MAG: cobalamin-dependent protein [Acidimicrobiales bacterium]
MATDVELLTLQEAADRLGVHYMTAYRHVRTGRLPAKLDGSRWRVRAADLEAASRGAGASGRASDGDVDGDAEPARRPPVGRLAGRLASGDVRGSWTIVEEHLASGATPEQAIVDLVGAAMRLVGDRWADGTFTVADEHQATTTTVQVISRIGSTGARRGRRLDPVLVGCAPHDPHAMATALLAEVLRRRGHRVTDLGGDVPAESFASVAASARFRAVCVSVSTEDRRRDAADAIEATRWAAPQTEVFAGGAAIRSLESALAIGAQNWARDASALADALARDRRR